MLDKINMLREKLECQILNGDAYKEILFTSKEIDTLILEYYEIKSNDISCNLALVK